MADIIDINELRKSFDAKMSVEQWITFAEKQNQIIDTFQKRIKELEEKNKHLENLLMNRFSDKLAPLAPEEIICLQQIDRLEKISNERQLTLEEVKRLDLLIKNLKLIREESTIVVNNRKSDNIKEADLVAIAKSQSGDSEDNT